MEKDEIKNYIDKLKELESSLIENEESADNDDFIGELDSLLNSLSKDIQGSYGTSDVKIPVKIKRLNKDAVIPTYSKVGDAGMDLTATSVEYTNDYISYKTGLAFEIPKGYVGLLFPRSSNSKKDLLLTNSVGVIDSGYRGEIELRFKGITHKSDKETFTFYEKGDRVGQIMIIPYPQIEFIETDELSDSERGEGGFGSTN